LTVRDPAIARHLIERGADVNATDADGTTPLMQAVRSQNPELVKVLIEAQANLDARNTNYHTTALMDAEGRCEECAALLRQAGAQDDRVAEADGEPIDESHEAFAVCCEYLSAVFAADPARLRELATPELGEHFAGVDFPTWQESRPTQPRLVGGFVRGDHATLTIVGPNPRGADRTWIYQLQRRGDSWLVSRERWAD
jgi:ankyrin repeat protein